MIPQGLIRRADTFGKGIEYRFSILINESETSTYLVDTGTDVTSFQTSEAGPLYLKRISRQWKPNGKLLVTYYCVNNLDTFSLSIVPRKTNMSYSNRSFQFLPEHFGVHKAQALECSTTKGGSSSYPRLNIDGVAAGLNDWVYDNATSSSAGSADFSGCPVAVFTLTADVLKFFLANPLPTVLYTCRFSGKTSTSSSWRGINGSFGNGVTPDLTTTGVWLARDSKYEVSNSGYYSIRTMETAPRYISTQFLWDPAKFPTWTW